MNKEKLIELHTLLSDLSMYIARSFMPPNWEAKEVEEINDVLEIIERLIKKI